MTEYYFKEPSEYHSSIEYCSKESSDYWFSTEYCSIVSKQFLNQFLKDFKVEALYVNCPTKIL